MLLKPFKGSQKGFSLVELMVVVGIIGILAALAIPRFANFQAKAKQAEAKSSLGHIHTLETAYHTDHDTYTATIADIGFQSEANARYAYTITAAGVSTFTGQAAAAAGVINTRAAACADTWTINEAKTIAATTDCANQ